MANNNITWGSDKKILNTQLNNISEYIDANDNSDDSYGYINENDYMTLNSDTLSLSTNFKITCNSAIDSSICFCSDLIPYSYDVKVSLIGSSDYNANDTPYYTQIIWNSYNTEEQSDSTHYTKNPDSLYKWASKELTPFQTDKHPIYYKGKSTDTGGSNRKYLQFAFKNSDKLLNYTRGIDINGDAAYPSVFISSSSTEESKRNLLLSNVDVSKFKKYENLLNDGNTYTLKPMYFKSSGNYYNIEEEFTTYYPDILTNFKTDTSDYKACLNKSSGYKNLEATTNTTYYLTQSNIYIKDLVEYISVYTQAAFTSDKREITGETFNFIIMKNNKGNITLSDITSGLQGDGNKENLNNKACNLYCPIVLVLYFETTVTLTGQSPMDPQHRCFTIPIPKDKLGENINFTSDDCIYSLYGTQDSVDDTKVDLNQCLFYKDFPYVYLNQLNLYTSQNNLEVKIQLKNIMSSISTFSATLKRAYVYCFRG